MHAAVIDAVPGMLSHDEVGFHHRAATTRPARVARSTIDRTHRGSTSRVPDGKGGTPSPLPHHASHALPAADAARSSTMLPWSWTAMSGALRSRGGRAAGVGGLPAGAVSMSSPPWVVGRERPVSMRRTEGLKCERRAGARLAPFLALVRAASPVIHHRTPVTTRLNGLGLVRWSNPPALDAHKNCRTNRPRGSRPKRPVRAGVRHFRKRVEHRRIGVRGQVLWSRGGGPSWADTLALTTAEPRCASIRT